MTDYAGLIERLEKATGPDRHLDVTIYNELVREDGMIAFRVSNWSKEPGSRLDRFHDGYLVGKDCFDKYANDLKHYTASLDAAMALVERVLPGWWLESMSDEVSAYQDGPVKRIGCAVVLDCYGNTPIQGSASTRPIAVLVALLRAIEKGNHHG